MYTTPDEDRSDIYLSGAVYVLGPEIFTIITSGISLPRPFDLLLSLLIVLATTVLTPFLLMRYRKERLSTFGFNGDVALVGQGLLLSLPIPLAHVLGNVLNRLGAGGGDVLAGVRVYDAAQVGLLEGLITIISGFCVALLAIYVTVKARTAFRADPGYIRSVMFRLGRIVGIVAGVASVLLFATVTLQAGTPAVGFAVFLAPLGVAATVWLIYRSVPGSLLTSRATLLTPMVVLAIGSVRLFGPAASLVSGLWVGAMLAGVALAIAALNETRRSAWAPLGLSPLLG
jgi:hypothetical protein